MDGDKNLTCFTGYRWNMICWNFSQTRIDFQMNFNFRFPFVVKQNFNTNNSYLFHGFYKKCLIVWVFLLFTYCQIILEELFLDVFIKVCIQYSFFHRKFDIEFCDQRKSKTFKDSWKQIMLIIFPNQKHIQWFLI